MPNISTITGQVGTNTYTYIVPVGVYAMLSWLHCIYTPDSASARQIALKITDSSDNVLIDFHAGSTQTVAAARHYSFVQGIYRETAFVDNEIQIPIAQDLVLEPGYKIVISDENTVSSGDAMAINFQYKRLV